MTRLSREKASGSVSPVAPDIKNGRSYRHAAYTILKNFALRVVQTAFRGYTTHCSREKPLEILPVTPQIPRVHVYFPGHPGQDESCPLQQPLLQSRKVYVEGHALHFAGTIVAIGFHVNGL